MNTNTICMIISFLILISPFFFKRKNSPSSIPSLTTTFGILGTFIGIFVGLIDFDTNDIQASVPQLLFGLKTAFLTSIAGMSAGLLVKILPQVYGISIQKETQSSEENEIDTIIKYLSEITDNQRNFPQNLSEQMTRIQKALCGDGDYTLLTQLQKIRTTIVDKNDEIIYAFRCFTEQMAENNSKALIDALTQVMKDFNAKINEQFGDNFKELNSAVGRMLEWQREYASQINIMTEEFNRTAKAIDQCERSLCSITDNARNFANISDQLQETLTGLLAIRDDLSLHLKAFSDLSISASNAFPIIDSNLKKLTGDLDKSIVRTTTQVEDAVKAQLGVLEQAQINLRDGQKSLGVSLAEMVGSLNKQIEKLMNENTERITQQITNLDKELGNELTKSLNTLGSQLAALSSKFVTDYSPLTEQLRRVVQIARVNA